MAIGDYTVLYPPTEPNGFACNHCGVLVFEWGKHDKYCPARPLSTSSLKAKESA